MWDSTANRTLLDNRQDAVALIAAETKTIIYQNHAARTFMVNERTVNIETFLSMPEVQNILRLAVETEIVQNRQLDSEDYGIITLSAAPLIWEGKLAIMLAVDKPRQRISNELPEVLMRLLERKYFSIVAIAIPSMESNVIASQNPMLSAHPVFSSFQTLHAEYAKTAVHPSDKDEFIERFSDASIIEYAEKHIAPPEITVRRLSNGLYTWARFTLEYVSNEQILFLAEDVNEKYLEQERTKQYCSELKTLSLRNSYILSSVSDIFRLLIHIDLSSGDAVICALHPSLRMLFSCDKVYAFDDIANRLLNLVHPDDVESLRVFSDLSRLRKPIQNNQTRFMQDYRRVSPQKSLDDKPKAKWTRSVMLLSQIQDGIPTEAIYAVQDVHEQKLHELEAKRKETALTAQFYTLLQHRFIWFIECDYTKQICYCCRVIDNDVKEAIECPFDRIFELLLIPYCHPDDIKKVAKLYLPDAVKNAYQNGKTEIVSEYRHKTSSGWKWVRVEMYICPYEDGSLHSLIYAADIDSEKQQMDASTKADHQQLTYRRRMTLPIRDSIIHVNEIDLDADTISEYIPNGDNFELITEEEPFSQMSTAFINSSVYPAHRQRFTKLFSYPELLRASRNNVPKIQMQFLYDANKTQQYIWCCMNACFFRDENGRQFLMTYLENIHGQITEYDLNRHEIEIEQERLRTALRLQEQAQIQKAHIFSNLVSDVRLSLNQIIGSVDTLSSELPSSAKNADNYKKVSQLFQNLQQMIDRSHDVLLLENGQLPLLNEPITLPKLLERLRNDIKELIGGKRINLLAYTHNVRNETIFCDSSRLLQLLESTFLYVVRDLPDESVISLSLKQNPIENESSKAEYVFSILTEHTSPEKENDSTTGSPTQPNITMHINKKLIARMNGSFEIKTISNHATVITLRLPLEFDKSASEFLFPQLHFYGKKALIFDLEHKSAAAISELFVETGMQQEWESEFSTLCSRLKEADAQDSPYELLLLRQADINMLEQGCFKKLQAAANTKTKIMLLCDAPIYPPTDFDPVYPPPYLMKAPLFRSTLAKTLWQIYKDSTPI